MLNCLFVMNVNFFLVLYVRLEKNNISRQMLSVFYILDYHRCDENMVIVTILNNSQIISQPMSWND